MANAIVEKWKKEGSKESYRLRESGALEHFDLVKNRWVRLSNLMTLEKAESMFALDKRGFSRITQVKT